ncbi:MAG TPA: hypothetical protein VFD13_06235 [Candidatus Kapabacteria bacterium]|nr:hypothetical protein [Candidatus Kapabacteria bacterium]
MKSTSLLAALAFAAASLLSSCKQDGQSINGPNTVLPLNTSTPAANPVITYVGESIVHRTGYPAIAVMNADGSNKTIIYTSPSTGTLALGENPCWSPDGGSIAWIENYDTIKAIDVSVNSHGVPVGSNLRTIYATTAGSNNFIIHGLSWCSESATGELAFVAAYSTGGGHGASTVYTIGQTGGTPTALITESQNLCYSVSWSPDDSKIAFSGRTVPGAAWYLRVADASSGALLEADSVPQVNHVEWERSGNTIAFDNSSKIYYLDYGSGNGEYTENVSGTAPTWSPNDADIMFTSGSTVKEIPAFGTSTSTITTISSLGSPEMKWKR